MEKLRERAAELISGGTVGLIIGYEEGTEHPHPFFCRSAEDASKLVYNTNCFNNLAVYITKKELTGSSRIGIVATIPTLRSILQLAVENQITEEKLLVLTITGEGELKEFESFKAIEEYISEFQLKREVKEQEILEMIEGMTREERFQFWMKEMSNCFKCYACRAACPLCYCSKCVVEVNRPQWINPWAAPLSNMEWHINRAMHMVGRCTACGACGEACPVGIPVHLIPRKMLEELSQELDYTPGQPFKRGNALSVWRPDDKENFIR